VPTTLVALPGASIRSSTSNYSAGRPAVRGRRARLSAYAGIFTLAFLARLVIALAGGRLFTVGSTYDEWVHYGAAKTALSGQMPYSDFTLLHPPGIVLVLRPLAWMGGWWGDRTAIIAGRVGVMAVTSLTAVGIAWAARRLGLVASLAAGVFAAIWRPEAVTGGQLQLEPFLNAALIGAVLLADLMLQKDRRRWAVPIAIGLLLGLALSIKLVAAGPLVVVIAFLWMATGVRVAATTAGAAALAWAALVAPFALNAPSAAFNQIVGAQLSRPVGEVALRHRFPLSALPDGLAIPLIVAVGALTLLALGAWAVRSRPDVPMGLAWAAFGVAGAMEILIAAKHYLDYDTLLTGPIAYALGAFAVWFLRRPRGRVRWPMIAAGVAVVGMICVMRAPTVLPRDVLPEPGRPTLGELSALRAATAGAQCVGAVRLDLTAMSDTLTRNLDRGCPVTVDRSGMRIMAGAHLPFAEVGDQRPKNRGVADAAIMARLLSSDVVLLDERWDQPFIDRMEDQAIQPDGHTHADTIGQIQVWRSH
jgi:hypothetical protein